jgi:single-strand DNA-binding protein
MEMPTPLCCYRQSANLITAHLSTKLFKMKSIKNHVQLVGNTGRDVEIKTFDSGTKKATVSFATTDYYKNTKGEFITQTQWHNLVAWGGTAELLSKIVHKGDHLIVKGSINYRTYEDKSGLTRNITEILVEDFMRTTLKKEANKVEKKTPNKGAKKEKEVLPF